MASQITATLPTLDFPKEVDYPTQEDWAAFSAAAEVNFGILGGSWSTQMQLWKTEANLMSIELNTNATIAQGLANYQGDWISQGYTLGQTVSVSGIYYICKLTHASGQNPTDSESLYWSLALGNWSLKADKTEVDLKVNNYGNETIAGVKTFTSSPIVPTPTTYFQAATKKYVDDKTVASSETVAGIIELATTAEAQEGTDDLRAITSLKLKNSVIGLGQTWQDVTGSRAKNTTYTNSTGKPIMICPTMDNNGPTEVRINNVIVGYITSWGSPSGSSCYLVPKGSTYLINGGVAMLKWFELR